VAKAKDEIASSTETREVAVYPWHEALWRDTHARLAQLPHALLVHGARGLGKSAFAERLGRRLLCATPTPDDACGHCKSCLLFRAGNHPDYLLVTPAPDSTVITVDQVRALNEFLTLKPHSANAKVVVLSPAEAMNVNAANSLLKRLEEPPSGSYLLLVGHERSRLLPTVRSRCAQLSINPPSRETALAWLASTPATADDVALALDLAGGAPLLAREYQEQGFVGLRRELLQNLENLAHGREPVTESAAVWKKAGTALCVTWLQALVTDAIKLKVAANGPLVNPDLRERLNRLIKDIRLKDLHIFLDTVSDLKNHLQTSLDELLLLEDTLLRWQQLTERKATL
jgi:DNA polymerase-3 subunit delta'